MYYAAEAFNKTLCNLLKKVVAKSLRDLHERIGEALWAYRTTIRTPTQVTPYTLVYGVKAVLPLEQQIPSLRLAIQEGLTEEENAQIRLEELEALDEKRLEAQHRVREQRAQLRKLRIILSTKFFKAQEYSKVFKAKIESFFKVTPQIIAFNWGFICTKSSN
ncbi:UNVERIFIED_CONTAM: hypothetical protein Sradi_7125200 [Sesamum radiatum]|uniref:Uncharacterized protein n=1 Tax=Sesamum radiatum TaxID=300843 RepID=A0AAW2IZT2_SESRA